MNRNKIFHAFSFRGNKVTGEKKFWMHAILVYGCVEIFFLLFSYGEYKRNCVYCQQPFMSFVTVGLLDVLFTVALWYALDRLHRFRNPGIIVLNFFVFAGYIILFIGAKYLIIRSGLFQPAGTADRDGLLTELINSSWFDIGKYVLKLSAFYLLRFYLAYRKAEWQRTELAVINKDLQLNLLKQQLSPHFYFNTLNNLYGLARNNSPKLSGALSQLSNIMHYVINDCNKPKVLLRQEISFLQSYIALEKLRYEENTMINMTVEGKVNGQLILPLLLIQFVENAFKHGMKEKSEKNWMRVKMMISDHELLFSVDNSYYATSPAGGIGLANVEHRLNLQYEGKYDMNLTHERDRFSLTLKLNLS